MDLIVKITNNLHNIITVTEDRDIQNNLVEKYSDILERIAEIQNKEFKEKGEEGASANILSFNQSVNLLILSDSLFSLNLTESQRIAQMEKTKNINKVMVMCLQANMKEGTSEKLVLEHRILEYSSQKGEIFQDKQTFADIQFPALGHILPQNDIYGISRTIWKMNPFLSIHESLKLVANMTSIEITSLSTYKEITLTDLENYIEVKFDINQNYISWFRQYYCIYYNPATSAFSNHNLPRAKNYNSGKIISCKTPHLSWFGVISQPLVTIFTENNAKMLYDLSEFGQYSFWKSESNKYNII